jgi:hypothetical protein
MVSRPIDRTIGQYIDIIRASLRFCNATEGESAFGARAALALCHFCDRGGNSKEN